MVVNDEVNNVWCVEVVSVGEAVVPTEEDVEVDTSVDELIDDVDEGLGEADEVEDDDEAVVKIWLIEEECDDSVEDDSVEELDSEFETELDDE